MKQLYYTSCRPGQSVNGRSGFQVRSLSPGVSADYYNTLIRYVGYVLPPGYDEHDQQSDEAPVRLSLFETPTTGRVLCHTVYADRDPTTNRQGNFFSHVLFQLPKEFSAREAIQTWQSPFWQRKDGEQPIELPEISTLPPMPGIGDADVQQFFQKRSFQELFEFVLSGVVCCQMPGRVFVAAPAEDVARCISAVVRALPSRMVQSLTFSTYEHDPLASVTRITGTWWKAGSPPSATDLPTMCYASPSVAFNTQTGRRSDEWQMSPYARFAADLLGSGRTQQLDDFLRECDVAGLQKGSYLALAFKAWTAPGQLTDLECWEVAKHGLPMAHPEATATVLEGISNSLLENERFQEEEWLAVVRGLRPDMRKAIEKKLFDVGLEAARGGDMRLVDRIFNQLMPAVGQSTDSHGLWNRVVRSIPDPTGLSTDTRLFLLEHVVKEQLLIGNDSRRLFERWFCVPSDALGALLQWDIADSLVMDICEVCLLGSPKRIDEYAAVLVGTNDMELLGRIIQRLDKGGHSNIAKDFFEATLRAVEERPLFVRVSLFQTDLSDNVRLECLRRAVAAGVHVASVIAPLGPRLLESLSPAEVTLLVEAVLRGGYVHTDNPERVRSFLDEACELGLTDPERVQRFRSDSVIQEYIARPTFQPEKLRSLRLALSHLTSGYLSEVIQAIVSRLLQRSERSRAQQNVEAVLVNLEDVFEGGFCELFRQLLATCRADKAIWRRWQVIYAFIAIALGDYATAQLKNGNRPRLPEEARQLIYDAKRKCSWWAFYRMERRATHLPPGPCRITWNRFVEDAQLTFWEKVRAEMVFWGVIAVVATIAFFVLARAL